MQKRVPFFQELEHLRMVNLQTRSISDKTNKSLEKSITSTNNSIRFSRLMEIHIYRVEILFAAVKWGPEMKNFLRVCAKKNNLCIIYLPFQSPAKMWRIFLKKKKIKRPKSKRNEWMHSEHTCIGEHGYTSSLRERCYVNLLQVHFDGKRRKK